MPVDANIGRGLKNGSAWPISKRVDESDITGWPLFSVVIIFKYTWYSIFERLKQLGYEREVTYFGRHQIGESCKALFGKSKALTDEG